MTTAAEWSGPVGDAWAESWIDTDRSFAGLSIRLDAAIVAAARTGEGRAIDLGCGAGVTSIALAKARPDLGVVGVDVSPELVAIADTRGAGIDNLDFAVADLDVDAATVARNADLLCSRHGVMFFADPAAVFAELRAGVRPGTPLVFSCFRSPSLNPWAGALAAELTGVTPPRPQGYAPGPFAFADPGFVAPMLAAAGWRTDDPEPVDYPYVAGEGADPVAAAVDFFCRIGPVAAALKAAPEGGSGALLDRLAMLLQARRGRDVVAFPAAAWI
ncbi:class I SAM-dependent methyltransferase [Sphingomonas bacterium]|uniref:class I SAM-dependent methyltransferase n=1 Tax=Sphingomonas bacterium TaxID=1895847 RepID=UPI001575428F|nr:class I SAM-dependent methyltransferase [Sphingomonas bacterium]